MPTGTFYEHDFVNFARRMNSLFSDSGLHIDIVKSTSISICRLLFNNNEKVSPLPCTDIKCQVCKYDMQNTSGRITSTATGCSYAVDNSLSCTEGVFMWLLGNVNLNTLGKQSTFVTDSKNIFLLVSPPQFANIKKIVLSAIFLKILL